ncbi:conserved hypothetical protein [Paenibacillus curdlanolyticus YK9]|uniref:Uncharacterized protein n=1 Tax=Paenibacillus curdlanolyticus YK9 TaxID=717606 RepID=E0IFK8_9BACL|nr:hypothetical protein [Paenibacillus curdlanolyticus]EFM08674.1 conserved hypothetical protein [Paenibacillus curdlanolyticus YK9]
MNKAIIDHLGQVLISGVRDASIELWEQMFEGKIKSAGAKLLYNKLVDNFDQPQREKILAILSQVVDTTIHNFLWTIEQADDIDLVLKKEQENLSVKSLSDGLTGELYTEDGWILRFSKKAYFEPS